MLLGVLLVALLVIGYGMRQRSLAVVSVHYSTAAGDPIEDLYVFAGKHKRWTPVLAPGDRGAKHSPAIPAGRWWC